MLYGEISKVVGRYLLFFSLVLLAPLGVSCYYELYLGADMHPQPASAGAFLTAEILCLLVAGALLFFGRKARGTFFKKEGLLVVLMIWFVSAAIAGLPFYLSGTLSSFGDAYFEAMSGLTTTGASVMHPKQFDLLSGEEILIEKVIPGYHNFSYQFYGTIDPVLDPKTGEVLFEGIEAVSKGLLFWRSLLQWLGGMGIVVLLVAVLPALGVGGKVLFQAEVPGPSKDAATPRIKETASLLWKIYLLFTFVEVILLRVTNPEKIGWFDALTTTFSTISTGGFTVRNGSIAAYGSTLTETIILFFMIVGSINFVLYFHCLRGKFRRLYEPEFITFFLVMLALCGLGVWSLYSGEMLAESEGSSNLSLMGAVRYGVFQTVSAMTSTGFTTANYDVWPWVNQLLMLVCMYVGGMSGSTAGGIKILRHFMLFRIVQSKIESIFQPDRVRVVKVANGEVSPDAMTTVLSFFVIVISLTALGTALLALDGVDLETALAVNSCMINNVGIAFRMAGPSESFAFLSPFSKVLSTVWMVLGRLEFFAVLVILSPSFWRNR